MLTSRKYIKGDYEKYIQLLTKVNMKQLFIDNFGGWSDVVSERKFLDIVDDGFIQLFFLKDVFIGYVSFNTEKNHSNSFLIHDIHIVKEFQGQGYGTEMLNFIIEQTIDSNINQLKIFVFEKNPSLKFYKKNNFKEIEHLEKSNTCVMVRTVNLP